MVTTDSPVDVNTTGEPDSGYETFWLGIIPVFVTSVLILIAAIVFILKEAVLTFK